MTKEFLKEELRRVANMMQDPDNFSKEACTDTLHSVLEQIPEWKDASVFPPICSLLAIYDNYDNVIVEAVSDQFFTLACCEKFSNTAHRCSLPYSVAETGMELYFRSVTPTDVPEPEQPSFKRQKVRLGFKKLDPEAKLPYYAHVGDAGMDVFALEDSYLDYGTPRIVRTGLAAEIPDGYELQVRPRSGLALKGVTVWNSPGTIDSKYRGEIGVVLVFVMHTSYDIMDKSGRVYAATSRKPVNGYEIKKGDRIAQLVLAPVTFAEPYEVQELSDTDRGKGGFGSTGV